MSVQTSFNCSLSTSKCDEISACARRSDKQEERWWCNAIIYDTDDDGNTVVIFDSRWRCRVADYEDQALEKLERREKKENEGG